MMHRSIPERPTLSGLEARWSERWEESSVYRFDHDAGRERVFAIDTPPPTVSGSLHVGHVFSYTHADIIARYQRMSGKSVFYPMGWDDNGLPTERRVQNYFGVRCDASVPYESNYTVPHPRPEKPVPIARRNFVELCLRLTAEDEKAFEALWRRLGISVDWSLTYSTIGTTAQRVSQSSFLKLLRDGLAYQATAPTLWDIDFKTPVAQAELEDREIPGAYHRLRFRSPDRDILVDTTRPELLPACVALVANPSDTRYQHLFGTEVVTPLFGVAVPFLAHQLADSEKGTGAAMVCTFGDVHDVVWWRELGLPVRPVMGSDGRLQPIAWGTSGWESQDSRRAQGFYDELAGKTATSARSRIVALLGESHDLVGEPRPISHPVKFYEKGDRPLEIISSRQWFIRTLNRKAALLDAASSMGWYPEHMRRRYQNWVEGLNSDWGISRQRFFGVPFPVWYPIRTDGTTAYDSPLLPSEDRLPIDPSVDVPDGYVAAQRGVPGGFVGDSDVMDTWATSSLTPYIVGGYESNRELFSRVFPMDLRPQGHDIIRTWLFYTILRTLLESKTLPWKDALFSGWVLDPDRKKMSKSKGNVVTPIALLEEFGSDAVRYWAASGRPGIDTAFDSGQMKIGRRLATKILNAARFILSVPPTASAQVTVALDLAMLSRLSRVVADVSADLRGFQYTRALERTEQFFWWFCDDYLELVKERRYATNDDRASGSANLALTLALSALLRLFAPFLPFVTEEAWSWWQTNSIHGAAWPTEDDFSQWLDTTVTDELLVVVGDVLTEIRKAKSSANRSLRSEVQGVKVRDRCERLALLAAAREDVLAAGRIGILQTEDAESFAVEVDLVMSDGA